MLVALTMGELISAFPMSGGMYWSAHIIKECAQLLLVYTCPALSVTAYFLCCCRWTATLALRSRVPSLAPYFSLLACRASLIGQGVLLAFLEELCVNRFACLVSRTFMPVLSQSCCVSAALPALCSSLQPHPNKLVMYWAPR